MVYNLGKVSVVWSIGNAFCKIKILDPNATQEHVTLEYFYKKALLNFAIPNVYYHADYDGQYYIVMGKLIGQTLIEA